jgi:predicted dienelactone hydrolase
MVDRFCAVAALLTLAAASAAAEPLPGYDRFAVTAPHRAEPLRASIWYPAGARTYAVPVGDGDVFVGTPALVGAAVEAGRHPLLLLSHGSGGNKDNLGWLTGRLAEHGVMVLGVDHPGSTSGDSSPRRAIRLDERALDLTAALDHVLADPAFGPHVDPERIGVLGFSLGGTTALQLAGARVDRSAYAAYCARFTADAVDCAYLARGGVDVTALPAAIEADLRDPRLAAVIAVDPGFTHALQPASVAAFGLPGLLVNLGGDGRPQAIDVGPDGSNLAGRLPQATYAVVPGANHFTFLGVCKPGAPALLQQVGEDPICDDPAGVDRALTHAAILEAITRFLDRVWVR